MTFRQRDCISNWLAVAVLALKAYIVMVMIG
jgi:hypothetical protein